MLYYAQGWYLAENNKPLFDDDFQAWVYGPAIPALYGKFKKYGNNPIVIDVDPETLDLDPIVIKYLDDIFDSYGELSPTELVSLTHEEKSWIEARSNAMIHEASNNIITKDNIKTDFMQKLAKLNEKKQ